MTEKLNRLFIYQSNGYKTDSDMYYLYTSSDRSRCYKCKFTSSCPYSYIRFYHNEEGNCVKCLRFIPSGEYPYKNVSLYATDKMYYEFICFKSGRCHD